MNKKFAKYKILKDTQNHTKYHKKRSERKMDKNKISHLAY